MNTLRYTSERPYCLQNVSLAENKAKKGESGMRDRARDTTLPEARTASSTSQGHDLLLLFCLVYLSPFELGNEEHAPQGWD